MLAEVVSFTYEEASLMLLEAAFPMVPAPERRKLAHDDRFMQQFFEALAQLACVLNAIAHHSSPKVSRPTKMLVGAVLGAGTGVVVAGTGSVGFALAGSAICLGPAWLLFAGIGALIAAAT